MICAECKKDKPCGEFVSPNYKGTRKRCEACANRHKLKAMRNRQKKSEIIKEHNTPGFMWCSRCFKEKPEIEFKPLVGSRSRKSCETCSQYFRSGTAGWRKRNPEQDRQIHDSYYEKHRERLLVYSASIRDRDRDFYRKQDRERQKANKEKVNQANAKWRAARSGSTPKWLTRAHIVEMEGFYLFCKIFPGHHVDHIIPLRGKYVRGLHVPWNLQVIPAIENMRKGNRVKEIEI